MTMECYFDTYGGWCIGRIIAVECQKAFAAFNTRSLLNLPSVIAFDIHAFKNFDKTTIIKFQNQFIWKLFTFF